MLFRGGTLTRKKQANTQSLFVPTSGRPARSMKRFSVRNLWNDQSQPCEANTISGSSESSADDAGNMSQTTTQNSDDLTTNMGSELPSQPPSRSDGQVSDGDKAGAMLLFSGIFLSLVGLTFTTMGWSTYENSYRFEWTQFLGPILLSVGGTFVLISICKFRILSCLACKLHREEGMPEIDLPPMAGHSFVFSGVNQPITFHRATVVQYIPPPYTSVVQDSGLGPIHGFQSTQQSLSVMMNTPPRYYSVYPMDNPGFSDDNETREVATESRVRNQSEQMEDDKMQATENSMAPPAYEELFPANNSSSK